MPFLKRRKDGKNSVVDPRGCDSRGKACGYCGCTHDVSKHENCPAFGKRCNKCNKQNHFANVCFGFGVEEISAVTLDDSQLVTLKLESGNYLRFQPDTGHNVMWFHCICIRKPQETLICLT